MDVTTTCRSISELLPAAQLACRLLFQECYKAGLTNIFITETYRSQARQDYLYEQGRSRAGEIVTWARSSNNHSGRLAWDIAVAPPASLYDTNTLNKVGAIARKLGITWGGDWEKNIDRPHFEVKKTWVMPTGYSIEGEITIPIDSKTKVNLIKKEEPKVAERDINKVSDWAKIDWEVAQENGYFDGARPGASITREEAAVVINRLRSNFLKLIGESKADIKALEARLQKFEKEEK
ncbi:M15 family metallopeptidase [Peribacillus loiseleuriae]|uniref:M15 family metallopeptidase n=1 Tax=Peribacillus loiseleuriae TaxID=1679170 RepID=UPI000671770D|nr:M15 family metallopeptidase [Peribacillus loiseleuriae]